MTYPILAIGDKVIATRDIWQEADEYSPAGVLARKGDVLVVRKIESCVWDCYVSHEHITDNSFGVLTDEIRKVD